MITHDENLPRGSRRGIGRPVKVILLATAVTVGFLEHALNGWGEPIMMAAAALIIPVFLQQFREFWSLTSFWITILLLGVLQVPLVLLVRPLIQRGGPLYALLFGVMDGLFVIIVTFFACSKISPEPSSASRR